MLACFDSPGPVHHAAHDGDPHLLDAGTLRTPDRHLLPQVALDVLRHVLEEGAGGAAAAGAAGHLRREASQLQGLQDLLRHPHLLGAVAARRRRQGHANRVADALLEQHREPRRARHDPLGAHARLGEAEVQRIVAPSRQHAVDVDQVLHAGDLGAQDDPVVRHADGLGKGGRADGALHHRFHRHVAGVARLVQPRVRVHQLGEELLVERPPVDADPHRLAVRERHLDDGAEVACRRASRRRCRD